MSSEPVDARDPTAGQVPSRSPFEAWLWRWRWLLVALFVVLVALLWWLAFRSAGALWWNAPNYYDYRVPSPPPPRLPGL